MTLHRVNGFTPRGLLGMTPVPDGWRLCSNQVVTDDKHGAFVLVQNHDTSVVCGLNDDGFISMADEDLSPYLKEFAIIKLARIQHGMTQSQLAKELGVAKMTISKWEIGAARATASRRRQLETILGIKLGKY